MESLRDFLNKKGAIEVSIRGRDKYLKLSISNRRGDRFESHLAVFNDEPDVLYVTRDKMSGLHIISDADVKENHNELHTIFKVSYINFISELNDNNIKFTCNTESY